MAIEEREGALTLVDEEHQRWHLLFPDPSPEARARFHRLNGIGAEEDRRWHAAIEDAAIAGAVGGSAVRSG